MLALGLTLFLAAAFADDTQPSPILDLGYVKYSGITNTTSGVTNYYGIRYAQAPVDDLRWRAPRPIELNNDYAGKTLDASSTGPACWQNFPPALAPLAFGSFYQEIVTRSQSEDCLLLNIQKPNNPSSNSLPIIVQIHGGGYNQGAAGSFPGDALVNRSNGDAIYLDTQYRLGLLGFLAGSEIQDNGVQNAGLYDQRAMLDWVQRNARSFGGDPNRVTIFGGSAGGGSVTLQLMAHGGTGVPPFQQAIPEYPWWTPFLNASSQAIQFRSVLNITNCTTLACLRTLPTDRMGYYSQLIQNVSYANMEPGYGFGEYYFGPVVDGDFVRTLPSIAFDLGMYHQVPMLIDHDEYEGALFGNSSQTMVTAETMDAELIFPSAGPSFFSRLYEIYPAKDYNSTFFQRQAWFGDFIINCPTYYMASSAVDRVANSSQVWKMIFAAGNELHSATAPFLFSNTTTLAGNNETLNEYLTHWFLSFAINKDPNVGAYEGSPNWPSYVSNGDASYGVPPVGFNTLMITYESIFPERDPDAAAQCDFFGNNRYVVMN